MPSDVRAEGTSRRDFALGLVTGSAIVASAWGIYEALVTVSEDVGRSVENSGRWFPEDGPTDPEETTLEPASIKSLTVEPNADTVDEYSSFQLKAEYKTGTDADEYYPPTIFIVDSAAGSVTSQSPMEKLEPESSGTWEMAFVDQSVSSPTTVIIHMETAADSFKINE